MCILPWPNLVFISYQNRIWTWHTSTSYSCLMFHSLINGSLDALVFYVLQCQSLGIAYSSFEDAECFRNYTHALVIVHT